MTKESLNIKLPALECASLKDIKKEWSWAKKIENDTSLTKAAHLGVDLISVLKEEGYISGAEYEKRLKEVKGQLGFQHAKWLVEHQDEFPDLKELLGKVYIDFPGTVVVLEGGNRCFPYLDGNGERWVLGWGRLDCCFFSSGRVAVSREVSGPSEPSISLDPGLLGPLAARVEKLEAFEAKVRKMLNLE